MQITMSGCYIPTEEERLADELNRKRSSIQLLTKLMNDNGDLPLVFEMTKIFISSLYYDSIYYPKRDYNLDLIKFQESINRMLSKESKMDDYDCEEAVALHLYELHLKYKK